VYCPLQLLELEREVVQGLVLRQPSLLARASEGLQGKVTAYADIFGEDVGQVNRQEVGTAMGGVRSHLSSGEHGSHVISVSRSCQACKSFKPRNHCLAVMGPHSRQCSPKVSILIVLTS
jgi:hypothetical protein